MGPGQQLVLTRETFKTFDKTTIFKFEIPIDHGYGHTF